MKLNRLLTFPPSAAAVALSLTQRGHAPPNTCCFTLHDAANNQIIKQTKGNGFITLSGGNPDGWYCIDLSDSSNILWDASNSSCFVNPDQAIQCLDPIPSSDVWGMQAAGEGVLVTVNGKTDFHVCGDRVYTGDKGGCRRLKLKVADLKGSCGSFRG